MSNQVGLLPPQTLPEALADLARHPSVGSWKVLACHLRPELSGDPEAAGKWLSRALDEHAKDVFHERHLRRALKLGAEISCHVLWAWHCDDVGYHESDPRGSKSRRLTLLEEDERLAMRRRQIQQEIDDLKGD